MNKFKPKSFHLQWHMTERCNLRCKHCYQDPAFLKEEVTFQALVDILEDFISQIKKWKLPKEVVRISLTGGEPLIRKDFFDFLEKCYQNRSFFQYGILTNGTFLDEKNIKKLKDLEVDYVQISLEGMEEINDYIRGKGVFKKAIKAVKLLKNAGINTNFSITVSKVNLKEVPEVINLSRELEVGLGIRRCIPLGSGKKMKKFLLEPKEVRALWHYILKAKQNFWRPIGLGCEDGMLLQDFPQYQAGSCSAGYMSFSVLPNGDVYPCRRLPLFSGNLLKQSFEDIYYNSKALQKIRNQNNINNICFSCSYYEKCRGGAKCMSFSYFKDASAPDPQCWRLFEILSEPGIRWKKSFQKRKEKLDFRWIKN
ncbi:MAG: radical SAM protein [Candidatus Nealsonbacteria bacterium]|nr:radical SAM protein [Candidatus Nealsonbacteria bacterium]